jgi:molybdopterin converting factor small subunit
MGGCGVRVRVAVFGSLRRYVDTGTGTVAIEVAPGLTVAMLADRLGIERGYVGFASVNGTVVPDDTVLHDGDEVSFFEPVSGG